MLFFHLIEDIKDFTLSIILPPSATHSLGTVDDIKTDIWDYHLDHKRWWQQTHNKSPLPTTSPKYGHAYPNLRYKRTIRRVFDYESAIILNPNLVYDAGPGTYHINSAQIADLPFTINGQVALPPLNGFDRKYWRISWNILVSSGEPVVHVDLGSFYQPISGVSGINALTVVKNELITNFLIARLNYLSFVDGKVLRKGIEPDPDPQPTSEPLWKGVWSALKNYVLSDIVSRESNGRSLTFFCIRPNKGFPPDTAPTFWEECNRPKTQIVSGIGVGNGPVTISQFNAPFSSTGGLTYLFPDRTDIRPVCFRPFAAGQTVRDWRTFADIWGLEAEGEPGYNSGAPFTMIISFTSGEAFNPTVPANIALFSTVGTSTVATIVINKVTRVGAFMFVTVALEPVP